MAAEKDHLFLVPAIPDRVAAALDSLQPSPRTRSRKNRTELFEELPMLEDYRPLSAVTGNRPRPTGNRTLLTDNAPALRANNLFLRPPPLPIYQVETIRTTLCVKSEGTSTFPAPMDWLEHT